MSDIDAEEARRAADEILSRSEFREQSPTLIDRVLDRIFHELGQFLASIVTGGGGLWIGYVLLGLGTLAAFYFLWRHFPWRRGTDSADFVIEQETSERPSRADWLGRAGQAQQAGRWDDAVHARYHAMTAGLADIDQLSPDDSATSGEHRRAFAQVADSQPQRLNGFDRATDRYEQVWFGGEVADRSDVDIMADADQIVLRAES